MVEWPADDDAEAWRALANLAIQYETLVTDLQENRAWEAAMRALVAEQLEYEEFTARRLGAIRARLRARKLAQSRLRHKYGFKKRNARLVRADVKAAFERLT